jgi:hypothetical protein
MSFVCDDYFPSADRAVDTGGSTQLSRFLSHIREDCSQDKTVKQIAKFIKDSKIY